MNSSLLFGLIAVFFLIVAFVIILMIIVKRGEHSEVLVAPKPLMTDRERRVLEMIEAASPGCRVHAQVAMAALITHHRSVGKKRKTGIRNRFDRKIIDFVIEHKTTGAVLAIVELDDRTHSAAKDKARDEITAAAGFKSVRLPAGEKVTADMVRERLSTAYLHP